MIVVAIVSGGDMSGFGQLCILIMPVLHVRRSNKVAMHVRGETCQRGIVLFLSGRSRPAMLRTTAKAALCTHQERNTTCFFLMPRSRRKRMFCSPIGHIGTR